MSLYSFCVKKKNSDKYIRANMRHELPFLDFFAMQFNNKKDLIRFLGSDPEKYDDIAIVYQNNHVDKILPLYFDALELEEIATAMIDFSNFADCETSDEILAVGYNFPNMVNVKKEVPPLRPVYNIVNKLASDTLPEEAYKSRRINKKALEYYERELYEMFRSEIMRSYIGVRKAYMELREKGYIRGKKEQKPAFKMTMQQLLNHHMKTSIKTYDVMRAYEILKNLTLTPYEENLVVRILADKEEAYEELMASDAERLEYLAPLLAYLNERRGNVKKIGPID